MSVPSSPRCRAATASIAERLTRAVRPDPADSLRDQGHHAAGRSGHPFLARLSRPLRRTAAHRRRPALLAASIETTLAKAQALTGVPEEVIVAIIGIETIYGRNTGRFDTLAALATLAFDYPPRAELFRRELEALLLLARDEGRDPVSYRGSYAGALGLPQFLPSQHPRLWRGLRRRRPAST